MFPYDLRIPRPNNSSNQSKRVEEQLKSVALERIPTTIEEQIEEVKVKIVAGLGAVSNRLINKIFNIKSHEDRAALDRINISDLDWIAVKVGGLDIYPNNCDFELKRLLGELHSLIYQQVDGQGVEALKRQRFAVLMDERVLNQVINTVETFENKFRNAFSSEYAYEFKQETDDDFSDTKSENYKKIRRIIAKLIAGLIGNLGLYFRDLYPSPIPQDFLHPNHREKAVKMTLERYKFLKRVEGEIDFIPIDIYNQTLPQEKTSELYLPLLEEYINQNLDSASAKNLLQYILFYHEELVRAYSEYFPENTTNGEDLETHVQGCIEYFNKTNQFNILKKISSFIQAILFKKLF